MKLSVCIPTYNMHGEGIPLFARSLGMLLKQTYVDFEVIITDNSENDLIKNLCEDAKYKTLNIKYYKNPRRGIAQNTNESMKLAKGELIKILFQDDYLANENSLQDIMDNFKGYWLVTGCEHDSGDGLRQNPHFPVYKEKIARGKNTIGSPSVLTIKNENIIFFDEDLTWVLDCDYYKRLYDRYGEPTILNKINIVIGKGKHQTTNHLTNRLKRKEKRYLARKYSKGLLKFFNLW